MKTIPFYSKIFLILLLCQINYPAVPQGQGVIIQLYDDFNQIIKVFPMDYREGQVNTNYIIGSIKVILANSNSITISGLIIKCWNKTREGNETFINIAITNNNGAFYIQNLPLGFIKMDIEYRGKHITTKYFFLDSLELTTLQSIDIPISKL